MPKWANATARALLAYAGAGWLVAGGLAAHLEDLNASQRDAIGSTSITGHPGVTRGDGCDYLLSPNGTDSGAGPWRSIGYASAQLQPGETLCVRGGTYIGEGGDNWQSSGTSENAVTIQAYPGETPIFDGSGQSHGLIVSGESHVVMRGLTFTGYGKAPSGDGALLFIDSADITVEDCHIADTGTSELDHSIYVNSGSSHITIRGCTLHNSAGTHIVLNHSPGPRNVLIEGNAIGNPDGSETAYGGVVVACTATGTTAAIRNNIFRGITVDNIQVCRSAEATVSASGNDPNDTVR